MSMMYLAFAVIGLNILFSLIFFFSTRNAPAAPVPNPKPEPGIKTAKLITKREAYETPTRSAYDYSVSSPESQTTPDSEPPES